MRKNKLIKYKANGQHIILKPKEVLKLLKSDKASTRLSKILCVGVPWIVKERKKLGMDIQKIRKLNIGKYWRGRKRKNDSRATLIKQRKGKTYKEIYGENKGLEIKNKLSKKRKKFNYTFEKELARILKIKLNILLGLRKKQKEVIPWNKNKTKFTDDRLLKLSLDRRGKNNPMFGKHSYNYKGGYKRDRDTIEYQDWRLSVYKKDGYTCQLCRQLGGRLNAHHIKSWKDFPDFRFTVSNGLTLCSSCHRIVEHESLIKYL
jgi:hypothetical protein